MCFERALAKFRALSRVFQLCRGQNLTPCVSTALQAPFRRQFSSSPRFERGFKGLYSLHQRCSSRFDQFDAYSERGVFAPAMNVFQRMLVFLQLQLPAETQVDAVEFLEGAKAAAQLQLEATNSTDLPRFLSGEEEQSESADRLQAFCTPGFYNTAALQVKRNYKQRGCVIECRQMAVESAHLRFVDYNRVTEAQYREEVEFMKLPPPGWAEDATIERMRLHVDVATVEDLAIHYLDKQQTLLVQQQNLHRFIFESRVTAPEDVDWRVANVLRLRSRSIEHAPASEEEQ